MFVLLLAVPLFLIKLVFTSAAAWDPRADADRARAVVLLPFLPPVLLMVLVLCAVQAMLLVPVIGED